MAGGRGKTTEEQVEAAEEGEEERKNREEKPLNWPKSGKEKWTKHSVLPVLAFLAFNPSPSLSLPLSIFDIMLEIIYHLNNNASNYVKMPYNRYDSWEGNARGRRMIFFVADDCWGSALTGLGWDGMGWDMPVNAQVQLEKSYQAWQLLGEKLYRYTNEEFLLNMSEADCKVSYRFTSNFNYTKVTESFNCLNIS